MFFTLVREMGLEPTRQYWHKHLKLACLPIPASPQISLFIISDNFTFVKHKNLHFRFLFYAVAFTAFYLSAVTVAINVTLPKHLSSARRFRPRTRFPTQNTYPSNRTRWNPYIPHWTSPLLPPAQASRCNHLQSARSSPARDPLSKQGKTRFPFLRQSAESFQWI